MIQNAIILNNIVEFIVNRVHFDPKIRRRIDVKIQENGEFWPKNNSNIVNIAVPQ